MYVIVDWKRRKVLASDKKPKRNPSPQDIEVFKIPQEIVGDYVDLTHSRTTLNMVIGGL